MQNIKYGISSSRPGEEGLKNTEKRGSAKFIAKKKIKRAPWKSNVTKSEAWKYKNDECINVEH